MGASEGKPKVGGAVTGGAVIGDAVIGANVTIVCFDVGSALIWSVGTAVEVVGESVSVVVPLVGGAVIGGAVMG